MPRRSYRLQPPSGRSSAEIEAERERLLQRANHLFDRVQDEERYSVTGRADLMYRLNDYFGRLMKLPISTVQDTAFRQADLFEKYESYLAVELADQREGAKVLAKWLRAHQLGMRRFGRAAAGAVGHVVAVVLRDVAAIGAVDAGGAVNAGGAVETGGDVETGGAVQN